MKVYSLDGKEYRLPGSLNDFQQATYIHLINWKWAHITRDPGKVRGVVYDAALPERYKDQYPTLYTEIIPVLNRHLSKFPFKVHIYFNHMASSQAANLNLFLPFLYHPNASKILAAIKPDFARLAVDQLDHGYRIEYWDEPFGCLHDKNKATGTDSDIAIAYYNHQDELCLWLIEHKLTENEFTRCGGAKSKRKRPSHDCTKSFAEILENKDVCFYHHMSKYEYWNITAAHQNFFANHSQYAHCPFKGGLNQLWRNQLLGLGIEGDERQPYQHVTFSVVKHPANTALDRSLDAYKDLIAHNPKFSVFTSQDVINAATRYADADLEPWIRWYKGLYNV
ncbi:MAG: hypothetical protein H8D34_00275 [Chloroflexi bacterium]|nr:hypothetical protein [Chloroflexota bacterium]